MPTVFSVSTAYAPLLAVHLLAVGLSVALFALRALGVARGDRWPMVRGVRRASVLIDTVLLLAGVSLWMLMAHHPGREPWLLAKLLLLPLYVVLGSLALKRAPTRQASAACAVAALGVALLMVLSAITRLPLGLSVLSGLSGLGV